MAIVQENLFIRTSVFWVDFFRVDFLLRRRGLQTINKMFHFLERKELTRMNPLG